MNMPVGWTAQNLNRFVYFGYLAEYSYKPDQESRIRPVMVDHTAEGPATFTFSGVELPEGFSVDANTGVVSWLPNTPKGRYTIDVKADASNGLSAQTSFDIRLV